MALHTPEEIARLHVEYLMDESAIEDDDEGFYDLEREEVIEALTDYREDDDDVALFLADLGFDTDAWYNDPQ